MEFNLAAVHETMAAAVPDREALVFRDRRLTHHELNERSRRLANAFLSCGLALRRERAELAPFESGQDHVALYLYNGNEYLEATFAAWKARLASVNVNYRYVDDELRQLLTKAKARAIVYHAAFAPRLAAIRGDLPHLETLIQVADDTGHELLPGAVDYEAMVADAPATLPDVEPSPDDLSIVFTGGTTGLPKGVLWRSADAFVATMGGRTAGREEFPSLDAIAEHVTQGAFKRSLIGPPMMHSAALWSCVIYLIRGASLVVPDVVDHFDPAVFLRTIEKEQIANTTIVGDAFARPLLDEMARGSYDVSSLTYLANGGAPLSSTNKRALLEHFPNATIYDGIGASETGGQALNTTAPGGTVASGTFALNPDACVLSEDRTRTLAPDDDAMGWLAQRGRVPLGYLDDPDATAQTFPVIDGVRFAIPGDRARHRSDGSIDVLGRDAVTINSGGEKIFAEEIEDALKRHSAVYDVVVAGRPSERWGEEVVAVVRRRTDVSEAELLAAAGEHVARYKLPKAFVFVDEIVRSPSGKADYRWARQTAVKSLDR